jgi:hypothetical protein
MTNSNPPGTTTGARKPAYRDQHTTVVVGLPDPLGGFSPQQILTAVYAHQAQPIADTSHWIRKARIAADDAARRGF